MSYKQILIVPYLPPLEGGERAPAPADKLDLPHLRDRIDDRLLSNVSAVIALPLPVVRDLRNLIGVPGKARPVTPAGYGFSGSQVEETLHGLGADTTIMVLAPVSAMLDLANGLQRSKFPLQSERIIPLSYMGDWSDFSFAQAVPMDLRVLKMSNSGKSVAEKLSTEVLPALNLESKPRAINDRSKAANLAHLLTATALSPPVHSLMTR